MALFAFSAIGSTGLGPLLAGWIESSGHLGWRWIQWISTMYVDHSPLVTVIRPLYAVSAAYILSAFYFSWKRHDLISFLPASHARRGKSSKTIGTTQESK